MKIVCLGDSLTYGYAISRRFIWTKVAAELTGFDFVNKGINGDTTGGMLSRFQKDVLDQKPDALIVIGGANDIFASGSLDNAKANMFSMRHLAANAQIAFIVGTALPIKIEQVDKSWACFADMKKSEQLCRDYILWLKLFCETFGASFIDLWAFFDAALKENNDLYLDGLHPNEQGHRIIAEFIAKKVLEIVSSK
jgi:lysophospholipase L1-like esterase